MKKLILFLLLIISSIGSFNLFAQVYAKINLNFETNILDSSKFWINSPAQNIWQIGKPHKIFFDSAFSEPNCIITDTLNNYPINCHSSFILSLHNIYYNWWMGKLNLSFTHKFDTDTLHDGGFIEVSYNSGITWENIILDSLVNSNSNYGYPGYNQNFYSINDTINGGIPAFTGKSPGWIQSVYQFNGCGYNFAIDSIMVRFTFKSDSTNNSREGWMIDNIYFANWICESISETSKSNFEFYPNPNNGKFNLIMNNENSLMNNEVSIYNILGDKIYYNPKFNEQTSNEIDLSAFQKGIYFIKIYDKEKTNLRKIVIQ